MPRPRGKHLAVDHATTCDLPCAVADDEGVVGWARGAARSPFAPTGKIHQPALDQSDYAR
ncbi:MAG: hypothetical protein DME24_11095 [Verrucomicrobia bacterium]|nr:MAG: hypothetical protein DME24_11095 [Verrucomicrobiota bacterium]